MVSVALFFLPVPYLLLFLADREDPWLTHFVGESHSALILLYRAVDLPVSE